MNCANCGEVLAADGGGPCLACGTLIPHSDSRQEELEPNLVAVRPGDVLDEKWRLERKLGEGGMGTVYLAHDLQLDRKVAVKLLSQALVGDKEIVTRFEREARFTASLEHPNIVPVYAVGRLRERPFMVMKALEGVTLALALRQRGPLTSAETLSLFRQLCAGLQFIHDRGFVHRDIKAGNIFVGSDGHATILDFGILRQSGKTESLTRTGVVMGTPLYMSPEQALGAREIDHRADLYALAILLFECVTNTLPFEADSDLKTIQLQAFSPPPSLLERAPWAPPGLVDVLARALAKSPDDRYQSATELLDALETVLGAAVSVPTQMFGSLDSGRRRPSGPKSLAPGAFGQPVPLTHPPQAAPAHKLNVPSDTKESLGRQASREAAPEEPPAPRQEEELPFPEPTSQRRMVAWMAAMLALVLAGGGLAVYASAVRPAVRPVRPLPMPPPPLELAAAMPSRDAGVAGHVPVSVALTQDPIVLQVESTSVVTDAGVEGEDGEAVDPVPRADLDPKRDVTLRKSRAPGRLNVITTHRGDHMWAAVFVDGARKGNTPLQLELASGRHHVRIVRAGFRTVEREIKIAPGRSDVLRIKLTP